MFSYYGSKQKIVDKYPEPLHDLIIEPFAGSARYALKYWYKDVILVEKYDKLAQIWLWLRECSPEDILSLPSMKPGETTDDFDFPCIEAKWLMGFMVQQGVNAPRKTVSKVFGGGEMDKVIERDKYRIAGNIHKIKHWTIINGDFRTLGNPTATWYIDPPYIDKGKYYHSSVSSKHIDFPELGKWCSSRNGQVMVCENAGAEWMDFEYLTDLHGSKNHTKEVIWYREE